MTSDVLGRVREDLVTHRRWINTPFGERPLVYADYTASGRSLVFLEQNIRDHVLPWYANTHTDASFTGARSNALREAARQAVRDSVNAGDCDAVIFCGSGATAAIDRLIAILGLRIPARLDERYALSSQIPIDERPVVFVGPYEHHSNELPWRESIADVVRIRLDERGQIDRNHLAEALLTYQHRPLKIGSFSAASNVTGVISNIAAVTAQLKNAGALSFWDYAAAGPYLAIDMNPGDYAAPDAVFLSPHKFIGGPGTPGVLVAKRNLLNTSVPAVVGGGTVSFVSPDDHQYIDDVEHREEAGTPAIIEAIRAGAAFTLKDQISTDTIEHIEKRYIERALDRFSDCSGIEVLGPTDVPRLGIFSLRLRGEHGELHYGFIARLLNDLFGIQARGGCSCAGPYGHDLLGMDALASREIAHAISAGYDCLRPGWLRINCHFAVDDAEIDYLLGALVLIAEHGWRLLPSYQLNLKTGQWQHRDSRTMNGPAISDLLESNDDIGSQPSPDFAALLTAGERALRAGSPRSHLNACSDDAELPDAFQQHCWFLMPSEALDQLGTPAQLPATAAQG